MNYTAEEILNDVKNGIPIIITDDVDRENEGDFFVAGSVVNKNAISLMLNEGRGLICTPISQDIASKLELEPMVQKNSSAHATAFTVSIDHISNSTGISLEDRLSTIKNLALADSKPDDFMRPGHIFPLISKSGGLRERRGHTEAAIDLCKLAGLTSVGVICEILNKDGSIARSDDLKALSKRFSLKIISIQEIIDIFFTDVVKTNLPTKNGNFDLYHFETPNESFSVLGLERNIDKTPLLRIHSECFTGDTFGSLRCDCGDQLNQSIKRINEYGYGFVVYLKHEGRGIGLKNKIHAYNLQDKGFDTFEANQQLGFDDDLRDYRSVLLFLKKFNIKKVKLISNNPEKINFLKNNFIEVVDRVDLNILPNQKNRRYFLAKKNKKKHILNTEIV